MNRQTIWGGVGMMAVALAGTAVAQSAGKPLKVSTGKPYGKAQTNSTVKDPAVDGQILRVIVTQSGLKPWDAGVGSYVGEKVKAGDRVRATLWLRASQVEAGKPAKVTALISEADPPRTEYAKQFLMLTDRWVAYTIDATVKNDLPAHKLVVQLQIAHVQQTIDVASISAVNLGPAS